MVIWTEEVESNLIDMLFETNLSRREMAKELGCSEIDVVKRIRELGLGWVRRNAGQLSRGQAALTAIMRKLLPGERITTEEPLPERLRLDVYCPKYKLAAEYHGRQHFQYVQHFHGDIDGYHDMRRRDQRKIELCEELGIALVSFSYCDDLSEDVVYQRMLDALRHGPPMVREERHVFRDNAYYQSRKLKQREYRKQQYRRMKIRRYGQ